MQAATTLLLEACTAYHIAEAHILQVQSFRLTFSLGLHDSLPCRSEVRHLHPHAPLPQGHQPSFRANGLDVGSGEVILLIDKLVKLDIVVERHLGCVKSEDLSLCVF